MLLAEIQSILEATNSRKMKIILILTLFVSSVCFGQLPPGLYGRYGGEMPGYSVQIKEKAMNIDAHDIFITISEDGLIYNGADLAYNGVYTVFKQSRSVYILSVDLSNGKSLRYSLDFTIDKKQRTLKIPSKNGQSEAMLEYISY